MPSDVCRFSQPCSPGISVVSITYRMDNVDRGRTQLLLFTIGQGEGAVHYYGEDGKARDDGSDYQHVDLDREVKGEKEGEQELKLSADKSMQPVQTRCTKRHCRYQPLTSRNIKK